jgi:hypothetical protein
MKRRTFIGAGAVKALYTALQKIDLFAAQSKATHYVGIGQGGGHILDYVSKQNPNAKITKAVGRDTDYPESINQKRWLSLVSLLNRHSTNY